MTEANKFWSSMSIGKIGHKMTDWQPGEKRSYIPVVDVGVPRNVPAQGLTGSTASLDGVNIVRFVVKGSKTQGTKARRDTKTAE